MHVEPLYEEFLCYLEMERNYSPLTISAYRSDGKSFLEGLRQLGVRGHLDEITTQTIRQYLSWLRNRGLKSSSIARLLCSLRSFWKYVRDCEYAVHDPFLKISSPQKQRSLPTYLSAEECSRLLEAATRQRSVFLGFRDKAALAVLVFTGVRRGELLNLKVASADFHDGKLLVEKGKGGKMRMLPLAPQLGEALEDWLELRPPCEHDFLFATQWGAPMGKHGLTSALRRALSRAQISRPGITLHSLRHTFACLLLQNGCDLFHLSKMLGHTRLDTTAVYLQTTVEHLRSALACHPLVDGNKSAT